MHPFISVAKWTTIIKKKHLHALVDHLTLSLVLQSSFCQVNGENTGNANNAGDPSIDEFGREAKEVNRQTLSNYAKKSVVSARTTANNQKRLKIT